MLIYRSGQGWAFLHWELNHFTLPVLLASEEGANIKVFPKQQYLTDLDQFRKLGLALAGHTGQDEGEKVEARYS